MTVSIDENLCIGCGTCESLCSACFKLENGLAKVINQECADCDLKEVAESCPAHAISVQE